MYPQLITSFLSTQKQNLKKINNNLTYIISNKIENFKKIIKNNSKKLKLKTYFKQI